MTQIIKFQNKVLNHSIEVFKPSAIREKEGATVPREIQEQAEDVEVLIKLVGRQGRRLVRERRGV